MVTVKDIQTKLKALGYYKSVVDGIAGPITIAAIKAFQKANGLLQDGIVGPVTQAKLFPAVKYPNGFIETNGLKLARQSTAYTCGPTALKMALSIYGVIADEMTLAKYAGSTPSDGSTHPGLIAATKKVAPSLILGDKTFTSVGWAGIYNHIKANQPVIVHVESFLNPGKSGHYAVIFGIDMNGKQVKLGDPSYGVRTVPFSTMETKMNWVVNTGRSKTVLMPLIKDTAVPAPVTTSDIQKKIIAGTGKTFSTFSQFYNIVKTNCSYAYYFNGKYNADNAVAMLIKDINGSATGLNCVDYAQLGVKLAKQMGYTAVPYGIWCSGDQINHAIFLISGKEFSSPTWIDLAAAASGGKALGLHWCSGALTKEPSWIPYE